jgi:hypothetical protein
VLDKTPQRTSSTPRGQGSSSQSSRTRPIIARPPIESHKLILESTFAIKEEFSNNEVTSWAVQELKNRGLKRLFKLVASTAYKRLVRAFYEHLSYNCDQPDVLVSSIDGREMEVTIADVVAILNCSHEPPESDVPWLKWPPCSPSRTLFPTCVRGNMQTVTGMHPAKRRFLRIFYSLIWCYTGTCVLWDTRHRGGTCSSVLFMSSTEVSGAPFPRSYGNRFRNSGKECTIGRLSTRRPGVCLSLFSSLTF